MLKDLDRQFAPEEYLGRYEAVLVDSSSCTNVLAGVPLTSIEMASVLLPLDSRR